MPDVAAGCGIRPGAPVRGLQTVCVTFPAVLAAGRLVVWVCVCVPVTRSSALIPVAVAYARRPSMPVIGPVGVSRRLAVSLLTLMSVAG